MVTMPPPEEPATCTDFSFSCISPTRDCRPWSCFRMSNGFATAFSFYDFSPEHLSQQVHSLVDLDGLDARLLERDLDPDGQAQEDRGPLGERIFLFQRELSGVAPRLASVP
jgi:hypothetical protein